ncbi:MAG: hypothetical protein ACJ8AH_10515 [Stellaceae bacterium]
MGHAGARGGDRAQRRLAGRGRRTGDREIASTLSLMNSSTSPPTACTAPAMRSNHWSKAVIIAAGLLASESAVKPHRSAESGAASAARAAN